MWSQVSPRGGCKKNARNRPCSRFVLVGFGLSKKTEVAQEDFVARLDQRVSSMYFFLPPWLHGLFNPEIHEKITNDLLFSFGVLLCFVSLSLSLSLSSGARPVTHSASVDSIES